MLLFAEELFDSRPKPCQGCGEYLNRCLCIVVELQHGQLVDDLQTEVQHHDLVVAAEVDAPVDLVPPHAIDEDASPLTQPAWGHDEHPLAQQRQFLRLEERLDAVLNRETTSAMAGEK